MNDDSKTGDNNNQFFNKIWRFQIKILTLHLGNRKEVINGVKF